MGRRLRCLLASRLVEVTCKTIQGRFLIRPSSEVNQAIKGTLGRAQRYTGLRIVVCVFLSNHYHLLVIPDSEDQLAEFMQFLNTNLSKQLGRLHDWQGPVFPIRYKAIPVSDEEEAQVARLRYLLAHGAKEGLVLRPEDWPGVHCVIELTRGPSLLRGIWRERTAIYEAKERGKSLPAEDRTTWETTVFSPLPAWAAMTTTQRFETTRELIADIEQQSRESLAAKKSRPLGERAILTQDPHGRPRDLKRSPAPIAHAATFEIWHAMKIAYWEFVLAYREASECYRGGGDAIFPSGCFPPRLPFLGRAAPA